MICNYCSTIVKIKPGRVNGRLGPKPWSASALVTELPVVFHKSQLSRQSQLLIALFAQPETQPAMPIAAFQLIQHVL